MTSLPAFVVPMNSNGGVIESLIFIHRLRSAPMQGGRAAAAAQGFTAEGGHLCGYEGGRRGQSPPRTLTPDQRVATWS